MKKVAFQLLVNNVDVTSTLKNYLISIDIENSFNTELKPGQMILKFSSNIDYTWLFTNTIRILLWWDDEPTKKFDSGIYYVDKASDSLITASQTYTIEASQQSLNFNIDSRNYFNNNSLYYFPTMISNIMSGMGISIYTVPTFGGNNSSISIDTLKSTYDRATDTDILEVNTRPSTLYDILLESLEQLGCVGMISNNTFKMYQIEQLVSNPLTFQNNSNRTLLSIDNNLSPNIVNKNYQHWFQFQVNGGRTTAQLITTAINNRLIRFNDSFNNFLTNQLSANRHNVGKYYQDLINTTVVDMEFMGSPHLTAGIKFGLGVNFGRYSKEYWTMRVVQRIKAGEWISSVEALPVDLILPTNLQITKLFNIGDNLQTSPIIPLYNIAIGKFYDATGYDNPTKRLSYFTVERLLQWVRLNSLFSANIRQYTDTEINSILTPLINDCIANKIRQDIAVIYAVYISQGFSLARENGFNVFRMYNQSGNVQNSFAQLSHAGNALAQRLTRVGTTRGYVGTPRDAQVSTWTQNGFNSINSVTSLSNSRLSPAFMRSYLIQMYIEMDITQYASVDA